MALLDNQPRAPEVNRLQAQQAKMESIKMAMEAAQAVVVVVIMAATEEKRPAVTKVVVPEHMAPVGLLTVLQASPQHLHQPVLHTHTGIKTEGAAGKVVLW
jgi:hypothetical protein